VADVKRWIHDAYAMQLTRRDSGGGDAVSGRLYGMARSVWMGKVLAAVENQRRPYPQLLRILYAPEYTEDDLRTLSRAAVGAVLLAERKMDLPEIQERVLQKLFGVAQAAALEYQGEQQGRGRWKSAAVAAMAGIDDSNWHKADRRWKARYEIMQRAFHRWELAALEAPRRVVEEIEAAANDERQACLYGQ